MFARNVVLATAALTGAALVSAQAAPNWAYVPTACASACAVTVKVAYQCETQFTTSLDIYGCYCAAFPSDAASCATCLNSNNAAALGSLVTSTITACPQASKSCFFQCSFPTCNSADIPCQCSTSYLQNIYNCASCNTANGNTGVTLMSDYTALDTSCKAQSYTGAGQSRTTYATPSVSNQAAYQAPTLTAVGGGAAATGGSAIAAGTSGFTAAANGAPVASAAAGGSTGSSGTGSGSGSGSGNGAAGGSAAVGGSAPTTVAGVATGLGSTGTAQSGAIPTVTVSVAPATTAKSSAMNVAAAPASGLLVAAAVAAALL